MAQIILIDPLSLPFLSLCPDRTRMLRNTSDANQINQTVKNIKLLISSYLIKFT